MRLLSIGSGKEQALVIKKAKQEGHYVIAIDGNKNADGFKYADEYKVIDISKKQEVIEFAKQKNIDAVLQVPIGRLLTTIGAVNDTLNLIGISEKAAQKCTDKHLTNKYLSESNINCAKQKLIKSKNENKILESVIEIGFPCIIKPRNGSGSNGVRIIKSKLNAKSMIKEHLMENLKNDSILEQLLEGKEYGIDYVVINGQGHLILIREKEMTKIPFRQEVKYICPANISKQIEDQIANTMFKAAKALGINNTLVHADIMIQDDKVSIIEISGRPSGLFLSTKIVPLVVNLDFIKLGIDIVTKNIKEGFNKYLYSKDKKVVILGFWDLKTGKVIEVPNKKQLSKKEIIEYSINIKIGDRITQVKKGKDLIDRGYIIIESESYEKANEIMDQILQSFLIKE